MNKPTLGHGKNISAVFGRRGFNLGQAAACYCRVPTADQTCARQQRDLKDASAVFNWKCAIRVVAVAGILVVFPPLHQPTSAATPLGPASWGTPDQPWATRRGVTSADRALIAGYRSAGKPLTFYSDFKSPTTFQADWEPQTDDKAGLKSCRRRESVQGSPQGLRLRTLVAHDCQTAWSTGAVISTFQEKFGFFEARLRIADIAGMNNAFWLTTTDGYEIDVTEFRLPNFDHMNLCNWDRSVKSHCVGLQVQFAENLSKDFHDFGVLWTPSELIFEVDGDPVGVLLTAGAIAGPANIRFSTALADWAGKDSKNPVGHDMVVQSVRVLAP